MIRIDDGIVLYRFTEVYDTVGMNATRRVPSERVSESMMQPTRRLPKSQNTISNHHMIRTVIIHLSQHIFLISNSERLC